MILQFLLDNLSLFPTMYHHTKENIMLNVRTILSIRTAEAKSNRAVCANRALAASLSTFPPIDSAQVRLDQLAMVLELVHIGEVTGYDSNVPVAIDEAPTSPFHRIPVL